MQLEILRPKIYIYDNEIKYEMKFFKFLTLLLSITTLAQVQTPQASTIAEFTQIVGLTEIKITYSRPAMKGRKIMGDLVPYGAIWRTGANDNSLISFSDDVLVGNKSLKAGKYSIYTRPEKSNWEVYFYNKTDNSGLPKPWDESLIAASLTVKTKIVSEARENFTISIESINNDGAFIRLAWEKTEINIPLLVPTDEKAMSTIEKTLSKNPAPSDYYKAAVYFRESGKDLKKAKKWIAYAIKKDPGKFWMYRQQALILIGLGEKKGAIEASKNSLKYAVKAGNQDYVRMNTKTIAELSR